MKLNLGSNRWYQPGWINVDLRGYEDCVPDLVHDIREPLPFAPASIDAVYMGHILEHLSKRDCISALNNVRAVLKPDGVLGVVGPDIDLARASYPEAIPDIEGDTHEGLPGEGHVWIPTLAETVQLIEGCGWTCKPYDIVDMPDTWPLVSRIGWQFALEATL